MQGMKAEMEEDDLFVWSRGNYVIRPAVMTRMKHVGDARLDLTAMPFWAICSDQRFQKGIEGPSTQLMIDVLHIG